MVNKFLYYKYVFFVGVLFSINALGTSILGVFLNSEWEQMSITTKFCAVVLVITNWTGMLLAFVNKSWAQLSERKPLITEPITIAEQK